MFQYEYDWDIIEDYQIKLEDVCYVDVENIDLNLAVALLLYLFDSLIFEDKFIDSLNNRLLIRL